MISSVKIPHKKDSALLKLPTLRSECGLLNHLVTLYNGFNAVVEFLQWTKWLPMVSNIFRVDEMAARKLQRRCLSYLIVDPTHSFGQSEIRSQ